AGETPREFERRLARELPDGAAHYRALTETYEWARYGGVPASAADLARPRQSLAALATVPPPSEEHDPTLASFRAGHGHGEGNRRNGRVIARGRFERWSGGGFSVSDRPGWATPGEEHRPYGQEIAGRRDVPGVRGSRGGGARSASRGRPRGRRAAGGRLGGGH